MSMPGETFYPIELDIVEPRPSAVDLASTFPLVLAVSTRSGGDLSGARCLVLEGDRQVWEGTLPEIRKHDPNSDDHDPRNGTQDTRDCACLTLSSPREEGRFTWAIVLPAQEVGGRRYQKASTAFSFRTEKHSTSLAVWDVSTPVASGEAVRLKVGAKCTAGCDLSGQRIDILDGEGALVSSARLQGMCVAEAEGLYWTACLAPAPADHSLMRWSVSLSACDLEIPHKGASAEFSFMTTPPPRHKVCVTVVENETRAPVADAQVRLGVFRVATDESGRARLQVPSGPQRLFIWKADHVIPEQIVDIDHDVEILIQATVQPKKNPYDCWDG